MKSNSKPRPPANHTYTYDAENRLTAVDGGNTAGYVYDALGRRVHRAGASLSLPTDYFYDLSGNVVTEFAPSCSGAKCWTVGYVYFGGKLITEYKYATTLFAHTDHLGSTRLVTDYRGYYVTECNDFYPFGEQNIPITPCYSTTSPLLSSTSHEFTGDERDAETSFDHTQFRQYTSQLGRWITPDPAGLAAVDPTNPQTWNRYAYVLNNPLNLVDPTGLSCVTTYSLDQASGNLVSSLGDDGDGQGCDGAGVAPGNPNDFSNITPDQIDVNADPLPSDGSGSSDAGGNSSPSPTWAAISTFFSLQPQIDAWNKGYYKCLAQKNLPGFSAAATAHVATDVASETASHFAPQLAGAYYHVTDARFTAWGKYSKVLVPEAAASIKLWAGRLNAAAWVYADYELAKSIGECSEVLH